MAPSNSTEIFDTLASDLANPNSQNDLQTAIAAAVAAAVVEAARSGVAEAAISSFVENLQGLVPDAKASLKQGQNNPSKKAVKKENAKARQEEVAKSLDDQSRFIKATTELTNEINDFLDFSDKLFRKNPKRFIEKLNELKEAASQYDLEKGFAQQSRDAFAALQKATIKLFEKHEAKKEEMARANAKPQSDDSEVRLAEMNRRDAGDPTRQGVIEQIDSEVYDPLDKLSDYVDKVARQNPFLVLIYEPFAELHISVDKYLGLYRQYFTESNELNQAQLDELNTVSQEIVEKLKACRQVINLTNQTYGFLLPEGRDEEIAETFGNYDNPDIASDEQRALYKELVESINSAKANISLEEIGSYLNATSAMGPLKPENLKTLLANIAQTTSTTSVPNTSTTSSPASTSTTTDHHGLPPSVANKVEPAIILGAPALVAAVVALRALYKYLSKQIGVNRVAPLAMEMERMRGGVPYVQMGGPQDPASNDGVEITETAFPADRETGQTTKTNLAHLADPSEAKDLAASSAGASSESPSDSTLNVAAERFLDLNKEKGGGGREGKA